MDNFSLLKLSDFKHNNKKKLLKKLFNFNDVDFMDIEFEFGMNIDYSKKTSNKEILDFFFNDLLNKVSIKCILTYKEKSFFKTNQDYKRSYIRVDLVFYKKNRLEDNVCFTFYYSREEFLYFISYKKYSRKHFTSYDFIVDDFTLFEALEMEKKEYKEHRLESLPFFKRSGNQYGYIQEFYNIIQNKKFFKNIFYDSFDVIDKDILNLKEAGDIWYGKNPLDLYLPYNNIGVSYIKENTFQNKYKKRVFNNGLLLNTRV